MEKKSKIIRQVIGLLSLEVIQIRMVLVMNVLEVFTYLLYIHNYCFIIVTFYLITVFFLEKLIQKRLLQERNRELVAELRQFEIKSERLKENIQASNIEKKQLISNQNNTHKHIKTILDFVNKFKDTSVSLHTIPVTDFSRTKIVLNSNELLNGS